MSTSDWTSLAACVAAFLALIPAFSQMVRDRSARGKRKEASEQPAEEAAPAVSTTEPKPLNALGRALILTSMAVAFGVIELVLFSAVAGLFGVTVDVNTMPTNWLVVFYALFLVPGLGLLFAFFNIVSVLE